MILSIPITSALLPRRSPQRILHHLGTFLGLGLGVCAAAWLVPLAVASVGSQWSLITAVGVLIICLTIGQWLGLVAGRTIRRVTDITPLKGVERFFGGVLNLAACAWSWSC